MKKIENFVAALIVKITYFLTYFLPVNDNKVAIISYFNQDYGLEFLRFKEGLENKGVIVVSDLVHFEGSLVGKFKYLFSFIHQTYLFNTCKIIVVDGNSFVHATINKKESVKVIQVWHATGAIKKFGSDVDNRRYQIKPYDGLIVSSNYFQEIFAKALATPLEQTKVLGIMKTDYLFDDNYLLDQEMKFYQKYPNLIDKKIVLYAPTFRGTGIDDMNFDANDIKELEQMLGQDYQLIVRLHPLVKTKAQDFMMCDEMDLYTMLYVSDVVISDYSALVYDASILQKQIILYLYDLQEYIKNRGLCVNIDEFPFAKAYNIKDVATAIKTKQVLDYQAFNDKYLNAIDGFSSVRVVDYIINLMKASNK